MAETAKASTKKKATKKKAAKKATKKNTTKQETAKQASASAKKTTKKRGPRKSTTWVHTSFDDLQTFRKKFTSEEKCAKAIGVSVGGLRSWLGSGKAKTKKVPSNGTQIKIKAAIEKGPPAGASKRSKRGPKRKAATASKATAAKAPAKRSSKTRPSEGLSLLAMAILDEDWGLARQAYSLLK